MLKNRRLRFIVSMMIIFALCLQIFPNAQNVTDFNDVPSNHWAYEAINYVIVHGYMGETDDGMFEPDAIATRAMMITVLYRLAGEPTVSSSTKPFSDVELGMWYSNPIIWAKSINIIDGHSDGTFRPNENMPREQIALITYRYANTLNYDTNTTGSDYTKFPDFADTPTGCQTAMKWAIKKDMLIGREDDNLHPNAGATRAEVATCIYRFVTNNRRITSIALGMSSATVNQNWVGNINVIYNPNVQLIYLANANIIWTSSNTSVASINSQTGRISAHNPGWTVITARTALDSRVATCTLTVQSSEYNNHRLGIFTTPECADAIAAFSESERVYDSIEYDVVYETYFTAAMTTATGGANLNMPDAAYLLQYFLSNQGQPQTINFSLMNVQNAPANNNMKADINTAIAAAEHYTSALIPQVSFTTINEIEANNTRYESSEQNILNNWYQAINTYRTWYSCTVTKSGNQYSMTMNYNMRDFYDWDPENTNEAPIVSQQQMYTLHCAGMAKHFKVVGQTQLLISWTEGQTMETGATYQFV